MPMRLARLTMPLLAMPLSLGGCSTTTYEAVFEGRTTWRSAELELDSDGGRINLRVRESRSEPVTILLLDSGDLPEGDQMPKSLTPIAAARGVPASGVLQVTFSHLPAGSYFVLAFLDRNRDGVLEESWPPQDLPRAFVEPHSPLEHFHVPESGLVNIALEIRN